MALTLRPRASFTMLSRLIFSRPLARRPRSSRVRSASSANFSCDGPPLKPLKLALHSHCYGVARHGPASYGDAHTPRVCATARLWHCGEIAPKSVAQAQRKASFAAAGSAGSARMYLS